MVSDGRQTEIQKSYSYLNPVPLKLGLFMESLGPPLWSSGQSFWLQIQGSQVRFPALPDFSE